MKNATTKTIKIWKILKIPKTNVALWTMKTAALRGEKTWEEEQLK